MYFSCQQSISTDVKHIVVILHKLKRSVGPNGDIEQSRIVYGSLFVEKKVELVSFDPERDEHRGLLPVSVTGHLGQRDRYLPGSVHSQRRLSGN